MRELRFLGSVTGAGERYSKSSQATIFCVT
jgi:hypothetical protein